MPGIRVKNGPNQGQTFTIGEKPLIIGRDESCELSLQDKGASRQHAELFKIGDMSFIRDLNSKNGTFVNDNRITEEMLRDGDRIQIGGTIIAFEPASNLRADDEPEFSEDEIGTFYELRLEDLTSVNVGEGDFVSEKHLRALYRLSKVVSSEESAEKLVAKSLAFVAEALRADGAYLFGRDQETGSILTLGSHTAKDGKAGQLSRTIIRKVLQDRRALLVTDAMRDDRFSAHESVMKHNIHAVMCVPLALHSGAESVLYIAGDDPGVSFNEQELELVAVMADQIGLSLSRIESKLRRREYMISAVKLLLMAVDARRPGVLATNERLAAYMQAIGSAMDLDSDSLERLRLAGMLHNYSEMIAADGDNREASEAVSETVNILSKETFFSEIEDIIAYQLERYDGAGPKGLMGSELPIGSRIFQVARDLETLSRDGGELKGIVEWLARKSGEEYDPDVVTALRQAVKSETLGMSLDEQLRRYRASKIAAFLSAE